MPSSAPNQITTLRHASQIVEPLGVSHASSTTRERSAYAPKTLLLQEQVEAWTADKRLFDITPIGRGGARRRCDTQET
jgi:hypothetical protein